MAIHPTSIIDPQSQIDDTCEIGPFCVIGPGVTLGPRNRLRNHVTLVENTTVGSDNDFFQGVCIGNPPQDVDFGGEASFVEIGNHNTIREYVTIHRATGDQETTRMGDHNMIMAYCHLGHNAVVENHVILVNGVQLAGYTLVQDRAVMSAYSVVHQFTRVGMHSMTSGLSRVTKDVPPFCTVALNPLVVSGLNLIGLRRAGFTRDQIKQLSDAFRQLFREGNVFTKVAEQLVESESEQV